MTRPIPLPELGNAYSTFSQWHVQPGDRVRQGERLAEVLIPGAVIDVVSPSAGLLVEHSVRPMQELQTGQQLGILEIASNDEDSP